MYTLVSASVLALDLARHPSGAVVADVVDRALVLGHSAAGGPPAGAPPAVVDLERADARARLLAAADRAPRIEQALRAASRTLGTRAGAGAAQALQTALVGRLDDLVQLLVRELGDERGLPREVVDVVVDRAVAAWVQDDDTALLPDVATLSAPWMPLVGELPPLPPRVGAVPQLLALLEAAGRADPSAWAALETAHAAEHTGLGWSDAVHTASRAAVEHGRTLPVARWQLSAVRAAHAAGHSRSGRAPGAAMSLVGAVQALAVLDVVPDSLSAPLLAPCREVLGLPA